MQCIHNMTTTMSVTIKERQWLQNAWWRNGNMENVPTMKRTLKDLVGNEIKTYITSWILKLIE